MAEYVKAVINAVQEQHRSVVSDRSINAPSLAEYPAVGDSAKCPLMLTHAEPFTFGKPDFVDLSANLVSRLLLKPIGAGRMGDTMHLIYAVIDDLITHYTDTSRYETPATRVIVKKPILAEIVGGNDAFQFSGNDIIEYPLGSGIFYYGFEMRFTVLIRDLGNCE